MNESKLNITPEQFEQLINLPAVKNTYTFYKTEITDFVSRDLPYGEKQWIQFAGVDFVVEKIVNG